MYISELGVELSGNRLQDGVLLIKSFIAKPWRFTSQMMYCHLINECGTVLDDLMGTLIVQKLKSF